MKRLRYILPIFLLVLSACASRENIKGVHVVLQDDAIRQRYGGEMGALADELKAAGVTLVVTPVIRGGTAYYPSDVLPQRWEYGTQLLAFRHELRRRNIRFAALIPVFRDTYTYRSQPALRAVSNYNERNNTQDGFPLCPGDTEYRRYKINAVREILLILQPDLLYLRDLSYPPDPAALCDTTLLEDLRHYCFCSRCRMEFADFAGVGIPQHLSTPEAAARILEDHAEAWTRWKCRVITTFLEELQREMDNTLPDCGIMLETPAWDDETRRRYAGQDLEALREYVDHCVLPPCAYSTEAAYRYLAETGRSMREACGRAVPSLALDDSNTGGRHTEIFRGSLNNFKKNLILYGWTSLLEHREYLNIYSTEF